MCLEETVKQQGGTHAHHEYMGGYMLYDSEGWHGDQDNEFLYIAGIAMQNLPTNPLITNQAQSKAGVLWLVCQIETYFKMFHHRIDAETSSNKLTVHSVLKQHILLNHIQFNKQLPHGTSILYPSTPFTFKSKGLDCFFQPGRKIQVKVFMFSNFQGENPRK